MHEAIRTKMKLMKFIIPRGRWIRNIENAMERSKLTRSQKNEHTAIVQSWSFGQ